MSRYKTYHDKVDRKDDAMMKMLLQRRREQHALEDSMNANNDPLEKEADDSAKKIVHGDGIDSENLSTTSSQPQGKVEDNSATMENSISPQLENSKGGGQQLDDSIKGEMESQMNTDLSDVRIHTDSNANQMSEDIHAKAFAHGQDIYFKDGNFDTNSNEGKELLAHELTHTRQQGDGVNAKVQRQGEDEWQIPKQTKFYKSTGDVEPFYINERDLTVDVIKTTIVDEVEWSQVKFVIDEKETFGWVRSSEMQYTIEGISVTDVFELPDEKSVIAQWRMNIMGSPFEVRATYEAEFLKTVDGFEATDQLLVIELFYTGDGFTNYYPFRLPVGFDVSVIGEPLKSNPVPRKQMGMYPSDYEISEYNYYSWRSIGDDIANAPDRIFSPEVSFPGVRGEAKEEVVNSLFPVYQDYDFKEYKAGPDITYTPVRSLELEDKGTVSYFIVTFNTIFGQSLTYQSQGDKVSLLVIDRLSYDSNWQPAATEHRFTVVPFVTKSEFSIEENKTITQTFYSLENFSSYEATEGISIELIKTIASEGAGGKLLVVPEGSIRSDQEQMLTGKSNVQGEIGIGKTIQLPAETAMNASIGILEDYNENYLTKKSPIVKQEIKSIEKDISTVNSLIKKEQSVDFYSIKANTFHEVLVGSFAQLKALDDLMVQQKDKKELTKDEEKYKSLSVELYTAYTNLIETGYTTAINLKKNKEDTDRKFIYLKNLKAAKLIQGGGEVFTNFYLTHKVYDTIKGELANKGFFPSIFNRLDRLSSDLKGEIKSTRDDFFTGKKGELEEAQVLQAKASVFAGLVNALSIYFTLWQLEEADDDDWLRWNHNAISDAKLEWYLNAARTALNIVDDEFSKGDDPETPPDMEKVIKIIQAINTVGSSEEFQKFIKSVRDAIEDDVTAQGYIIEALIMIIGFLLAEFGGLALAAVARGALLGARAISVARFTGQVLGFATTTYTAKVISGDKNASFLGEVFESSLMLGFLRLTSFGVQRIYIRQYGKITDDLLKEYKFAQTANGVISLQVYAEVATRIKTGEWMTADERVKSLLTNIIAIKALEFTGRLLVEPLENKLIDGLIQNNRIGNLSEIQQARMVMVEKNAALKEQAGVLEKSGELPDNYFELLQQAKNSEVEFLETARKGVEESDLGFIEKKRLLRAIEAEIKQGIDAVRSLELQMAREGLNLPLRYYTEGMEFYALGPGEVGFRESGREFLEKTYKDNKGTFEEVGRKSGVYKGTVNGETTIYIHESAMEGKLNLKDAEVKAGYEKYKEDHNLKSFFEVSERLSYMRFEKLDEFFREYGKEKSLLNEYIIKDKQEQLTLDEITYLESLEKEKLEAYKELSVEEIRKKIEEEKQNNAKFEDTIDLDAEEALGGHSKERHGADLELNEMEQRVMGTHPTLPQSRSALKFESTEIHQDSVNKAYQHYKAEIDAHFKNGGQYKEWEFDYGTPTGSGYTNIGTRNAPISQFVTSTKVRIAFEPNVNSQRGYYLVSAYPAYP